MNVANLYDRLNERERVSALVRGDDLETQRLNATAPQRTERRWHHLDRVKAVWCVTATVRIEMLATLADLWHSQSRLAWATDNAEADGEASEDINRDARLWRAFADVCCWKLFLPRVECSQDVPVAESLPEKRLLLRPGEVAKLMSVSKTTLRRLDLLGAIPRPVKVGRSVFWSARTLANWERLGCPSRRAFEAMTSPNPS